MSRLLLVWFSLSLHPIFFQSQTKDISSAEIAIENISVVDVENGKLLKNQTVLIRDQIITYVGKAPNVTLPETTNRIDGSGKYAIPGLWDMHIHAYSVNEMALFPLNGVTGVRLMWGMPMHHNWRQQFNSAERLGPRMLIASPIIDGPDPIWTGSLIASDKETGIKAIETAIAGKADFAKVYSLLPREAYFAIAEKCKQKGLPFAGHVPRMVTPTEASNAGQRSMEHMYEIILACSSRADELRNRQSKFVAENGGSVRALATRGPSTLRQALDSFDPAVADKLFATFKKNNTWQCPTLTVLRNLAFLTEPEIQNNPNLKYINKGLRSFLAPKKPRRPQTEQQVQIQRERFKQLQHILGEMHSAGVPIIAGTDVLNPFCLPGFSLHTELELLVESGLTPAESLQAATINAAKFQNEEKRMGSVAKGKLADIVLLNENPLEKIQNTRAIHTVIYQGKVLNRQTLDKKLDEFLDK